MNSPYAQMPEKLPGNITPEGWICRHEVWELSRREIGVSVPELGPGNGKLAESAIRSMLALGQIFAGRPSGKSRGRGVRYFATQQAATDYFSATLAAQQAKRPYVRENSQGLILSLAARPCGVAYSEMQIPVFRANKQVEKLVSEGLLFRRNATGTRTGKGMRFFTSQEAAEKYFGTVKPNPRSDRRISQPVVRGPAHLPGEPDFSKAKWIIAPPPVWSLRTNTHPRG